LRRRDGLLGHLAFAEEAMIVVFEMRAAVEVTTASAAKVAKAEAALKACFEKHFPEDKDDSTYVVKAKEMFVRAPYREEVIAWTPRKVHLKSGQNLGICGCHAAESYLTETEAEITCKLCQRELARGR
jgi:hypothetical protein